jgi:hypothetical protein
MINCYLNYVDTDAETRATINMIGLLSSYIIINKDTLARFPEHMRAFMYTMMGPAYGEECWKVYWKYLREHKEKFQLLNT